MHDVAEIIDAMVDFEFQTTAPDARKAVKDERLSLMTARLQVAEAERAARVARAGKWAEADQRQHALERAREHLSARAEEASRVLRMWRSRA